MKLTSLLQLIEKLQQVSKTEKMECASGVFGHVGLSVQGCSVRRLRNITIVQIVAFF